MGEAAQRRPVPSGWSTVVQALAAIMVGVFFADRGLPLAGVAGFIDLGLDSPLGGNAALAAALLAVAVAGTTLLARLPGWPVATAGLLLAFLAGLVPDADRALLPTQQPATAQLVPALAGAVGTGLALGGALLAVAQTSRPPRGWVAAGVAAGLVLHPVGNSLVHLLPDLHAAYGGPSGVQLWLAGLTTVLAAVVARRPPTDAPPPDAATPAPDLDARDAEAPSPDPDVPSRDLDAPSPGALPPGTGAPPPGAGRLRPGPVVVTALAALLTLVGLVLRWWVVQKFRLSPDGLAGPRRERAVETFAHFSSVALAVVVGLVLLWYAYRVGRAVAARWVVIGVAAGPFALSGLLLHIVWPTQWAYLILAAGAAALVAGAALARHAARVLPWDALGLVMAAVAPPLAAPAVRAELPSAQTAQFLLTVIGLGLAFGFGLVLAATAPESGTDGDTGRLVGVLALGPAGLMLSALALAPIAMRSMFGAPYQGPSLSVPVFAGVAALLLVLLFGFRRAVDRIRRDVRAEAAAQSADRP